MEEWEEDNRAEAQAFLRRLGQKVKDLRRARQMSQEELAEAADLVQHYVSQVEQGERNVSIVTLWILAKALDLTLSQLLEGLDSS